MRAITVSEKEGMYLKEIGERFEKKNGNGKCCNYIIISKKGRE